MRIIGLTGGVGSGKSTVIQVIKDKYHAKVYVADDIGRLAMKTGTNSYYKMIESFGEIILDQNLEIDRCKIAQIIFGDEENLRLQNSIIHPFVQTFIEDEIARCTEDEIVFIESAILVEAGYEDVCDEIWMVSASEDLRRTRLKQSRGYSNEKIDSIMRRQMNELELSKHCTEIIHNNGDIADIEQQLEKLLEE